MSPVRSSANDRSAPRRPTRTGPSGVAPAAEQPVLGDHREVELRRDEALPQTGVRERQCASRFAR